MRCSLLTLALASGSALASPALLERQQWNSTTTPEGCQLNSGDRKCYVAGDRQLSCIDWNQVCPVGWSTPTTDDEAANRAACAGKAEGDACVTQWTCCPPS